MEILPGEGRLVQRQLIRVGFFIARWLFKGSEAEGELG